MQYKFTQGPAITEEEALAEVAEMGLHGLAFDLVTDEDEPLHWHEFSAVTWVIEGTGAIRKGDGELVTTSPGCRLEAPAGFLHRGLAGAKQRLVIGTDLPYEQWTMPIDKDPADRPESFSA